MYINSKILSGVATLAFAVSLTASAAASEVFPAAIQEAAGLPCVPSCLLCHTSNPGTILTFMGKPFGAAMAANGAVPQNTDSLKAAYAKYSAANPAVAESLKNGFDPDNGGALCNTPTYGCGARIAKDEPRDDWSGLLFVAGAMGLGAILRRSKRR